jgi:hypothetical protein
MRDRAQCLGDEETPEHLVGGPNPGREVEVILLCWYAILSLVGSSSPRTVVLFSAVCSFCSGLHSCQVGMERVKMIKNVLASCRVSADQTVIDQPSADVPQISLTDVETRLDMHQYSGLFEVSTPEKQNGVPPKSSSGEYLGSQGCLSWVVRN